MNELNILIVDDQKDMRKTLAARLLPFECNITEAVDGQNAYEVIKNNQQFNLILSDIQMPRMDGYQLCKQLKAGWETRSIPVIIFSIFDSDEFVDKAYECGADAFISKGDSKERFEQIISNILKRSSFLQQRKILVVDDSPLLRKIVESNLSKSGFQVDSASNGIKALELLEKKKYDLILSDLKMPEMDGFTFCEKVKSDSRFSSTPFVVMTASEERRCIKHLLNQGIAGYIVKPFQPDELNVLIERILSDQFQLILKEKEALAIERNMMLASITSLVYALEARDKYTQGHSASVARIAGGMASIAGFSDSDRELLNIGASLHDIGKIGVRDAVLLKEGKLTDEEFDLINSTF